MQAFAVRKLIAWLQAAHLLVDLAPMTNQYDANADFVVLDVIDNSVVADTNTEVWISTYRFAVRRTRIVREIPHLIHDASPGGCFQAPERPCSPARPRDPVLHRLRLGFASCFLPGQPALSIRFPNRLLGSFSVDTILDQTNQLIVL